MKFDKVNVEIIQITAQYIFVLKKHHSIHFSISYWQREYIMRSHTPTNGLPPTFRYSVAFLLMSRVRERMSPPLPPLRTERDSFPSFGSSLQARTFSMNKAMTDIMKKN